MELWHKIGGLLSGPPCTNREFLLSASNRNKQPCESNKSSLLQKQVSDTRCTHCEIVAATDSCNGCGIIRINVYSMRVRCNCFSQFKSQMFYIVIDVVLRWFLTQLVATSQCNGCCYSCVDRCMIVPRTQLHKILGTFTQRWAMRLTARRYN